MAVCNLERIRRDILADIKKANPDAEYNKQWIDDALKDVSIVKEQSQAELNNRSDGKEYVNQSGGAIGADTIFGDIAALFGFRSNHFYDTNQDKESQPPNANTAITRSDYREGAYKATVAARRSGLIKAVGTITNSLIIRNWSQVKYADAIFAVTPITRKGESPRRFNDPTDTSKALEDTGSGGTAYAIEMAKDAGKPVYLFDDGQTNQWYKWNADKKTWTAIKEGSPKLTKNYAGIGSRKITADGEAAIKTMFEAQFGKLKTPVDDITADMRSSEGIMVIPGNNTEAKQQRANAHNIGAGVFGMRVFDDKMFNGTLNPDYHYGNPFGVKGINTGAKKPNMGTAEEVSMMFKAWLEGTDHQDVEPARREWILENVKSGVLDGKKFIYFKEEKDLTHVKVLRDFIKVRKTNKIATPTVKTTSSKLTNIWNSTGENAILSNLHLRPFIQNGTQYYSVEHAYQTIKSGTFNNAVYSNPAWKKGGVKIVGKLGTKIDGNWNKYAMETLIRASLEQNEDARNALIATGEDILTHTQDKGVWRNSFPVILTKLRSEFQTTPVNNTPEPAVDTTNYAVGNGQYSNPPVAEQGGKAIDDTVEMSGPAPVHSPAIKVDTTVDLSALPSVVYGKGEYAYDAENDVLYSKKSGKEVWADKTKTQRKNIIQAIRNTDIRGSQQTQTGNTNYDDKNKYNEDPATFSLDDSLLNIVEEMLQHEQNASLEGDYKTNRDHLVAMAQNIVQLYKDLGITADNMTMQDYLDASNKREDSFIKADSELNSKHIRIDITGNQTFSTPLELFLHEVQHIMIEKALVANPKMKTKIRKLRKTAAEQIPTYIEKAKLETIFSELQRKEIVKTGKALDQVTLTKLLAQAQREAKKASTNAYEMFLTDKATPTSHEVAYAKKLYEYVFHNTSYPESEFLAYASTNMYMQKMLEQVKQKDDTFGLFENEKGVNARGRSTKSLGYNLKDFVNRMIKMLNELITGYVTKNKNGKDAINDIAMQLFQISAQASKNSSLPAEPSSKFTKIYSKADDAAVEAFRFMTEGKKKKARQLLVDDKEDSVSSWIDRVTDGKLTIGIKQKLIRNNIFTAVLRDTADPEIAWFYDMYRQSKHEVDAATQTLKHEAVVKLLEDMHEGEGLSIFMAKDEKTNKLDESIVQSLKKVLLNIDYASITKDIKNLVPMLEDTSLAFKEIKELSKGMNKEVVLAAKRLGTKLVTGVDTDRNGFINAEEINRHYGSVSNTANIDKIASLYALTQTGVEDRNNTIAAIAKNSQVIQNSMNVYYKDRATMRDRVFTGPQSILEEKGFHIKHKDTAQVQHIVKRSDLKQLEKSGMKVISDDSKKTGLITALNEATGDDYVLVAGTDLETAYTQGLINTVQIRAEGMSFKRVLFEAGLDQTQIIDTMVRMSKEKPKYNAVVAEENFMTPERSITGEIKDYRIKVSYADQEAYLGLNDNLAHVIADTSANLSHKEEAIRSNINAVHSMVAYAEANYEGNEDKFTLLRGTNPNERAKGEEYEYAEKWNIIPDYARKEIERLTGKASIAIPNSLLIDFAGYKDASVSDFGIIAKNPRLQRTSKILGKVWTELVGLAKKSIVTKMFSTIKNNTVSNMIVTMIRLRQPNPLKYVSEFTGIWEALNDFQETNREIIRLEIAQKAGEDVDQGRIDSLKKELEDNRAYPLMKDGQYTSILEDIDFDMYKDDGVITSQLDKIFTKLPKGVKNVTDVVFLTNKSWAYQKIVKLTQLNDIANRVMLLEGGVSLRETDKIFVNYSYLDNPWVKWANDMGFLMFTKYMERSLSAMGTFVKKNPLGVGLFLATREALGITWLETPLASYFSPVDSIMNKIHGDDPMNTLKHGLLPFMFYGD